MAKIDVAKILVAAEKVLKERQRTRKDQRINVELDELLIYVTSTVEDGVTIVMERLRQPLARRIENQLREGIEALDIESIQVERTEIAHNIFPKEHKWVLSSGRF